MKQHDYRKSSWGHACDVMSWNQEAKTGRVAGFGLGVSVGDVLLMNHTEGTGRYTVTALEYQRDPRDMFFADVVFAGMYVTPPSRW